MRRNIMLTGGLILIVVAAAWAATAPESTISNKLMRVRIYLPDPVNGFYKGARFDWAGIINSVEFSGHTFYGQWFCKN